MKSKKICGLITAAMICAAPAAADTVRLGWLPDSSPRLGHGVNLYDVAEWSNGQCVTGATSGATASSERVEYYYVRGQESINQALKIDVRAQASGYGLSASARYIRSTRFESNSDKIQLLIAFRKNYGTRELVEPSLLPDFQALVSNNRIRRSDEGYGFVELCKNGFVFAERREATAFVVLDWDETTIEQSERTKIKGNLEYGEAVKLTASQETSVATKLTKEKVQVTAHVEGVGGDKTALQSVAIAFAATASGENASATAAVIKGFADALPFMSEAHAPVVAREIRSYDTVLSQRTDDLIPFPSQIDEYSKGLQEISHQLQLIDQARVIQRNLRSSPHMGWDLDGVVEFGKTEHRDKFWYDEMLGLGDRLLDAYEGVLTGFARRCSSIAGLPVNTRSPNLGILFGRDYQHVSLEDLMRAGSLQAYEARQLAEQDERRESAEQTSAPEEGVHIKFDGRVLGSGQLAIPELAIRASATYEDADGAQVNEGESIPVTFSYEDTFNDDLLFCQAPGMQPERLPTGVSYIFDRRGYVTTAWERDDGTKVFTQWNWPAWFEVLGLGKPHD